jgi:hypothetical protein
MTQIVTCSIREGIVLATDSRATWFNSAGETGHQLKETPPFRISLRDDERWGEVGPPFYFAIITPSGYREIIAGEVKG